MCGLSAMMGASNEDRFVIQHSPSRGFSIHLAADAARMNFIMLYFFLLIYDFFLNYTKIIIIAIIREKRLYVLT